MAMMKQWTTNFTGVANLQQESVPLPEPQTDEVLVKIGAVSINYRDVEGEQWCIWATYLPDDNTPCCSLAVALLISAL